MPKALPLVDLHAADAGTAIDTAFQHVGFVRIVGHDVPGELQDRLDIAAREFFALAEGEKARIAMRNGGRAWRGWFPLGGELTSGVPDGKEGLYFGAELDGTHPRVMAGAPLHGANLFPGRPATLRPAVLEWVERMTDLGHRLMAAVATGLGLAPSYFADGLTAAPTVLFRIFRYPPTAAAGISEWGVAEHTDYGLLTVLAQDGAGGLQVHGPDGWIDVPAEPGTFVVNIGDMLERMTGGRYRSTPHRVRNDSTADRLSFPFFFDPSWDASVDVLPLADDAGAHPAVPSRARWDAEDPFAHRGTYGEYLTAKVARVFPHLADASR